MFYIYVFDFKKCEYVLVDSSSFYETAIDKLKDFAIKNNYLFSELLITKERIYYD